MRHEPTLCEIADAVHRPAQSLRDSQLAARRGEGLTYMEMGEGMYVNVAYQIAVATTAIRLTSAKPGAQRSHAPRAWSHCGRFFDYGRSRSQRTRSQNHGQQSATSAWVRGWYRYFLSLRNPRRRPRALAAVAVRSASFEAPTFHMKLTDRGCKEAFGFRVVDVSFSSLSNRARAD